MACGISLKHAAQDLLSLKSHLVLCSKKYDFNPYAVKERRRMVLSMSPVDWAAEWLRPMSPSYKYVGPVLAGPGKALPADIEVAPACVCAICVYSYWPKYRVR